MSAPRLAAIAGLAVLLWMAIAVTLSNAGVRVAPAGSPYNGRSLARAAVAALPVPPATGMDAAEALAIRALGDAAINPQALGVVGLAAAARGNAARADRVMATAERLSRRDLPVQLYLIERAVQRDDPRDALHHYYVALTTVPAAKDTLFPVLIAASDQPALAPELSRLLARGGIWRDELAFRMAGESPAPAAVAAILLDARRRGAELTPDVVNVMAERLAGAGAIAAGRRFVDAAGRAYPDVVRNADFADVPLGTPFDWQLTPTATAGVVQETGTVERGLVFALDNGPAGSLARQLVRLPAGARRLRIDYRWDGAADAVPVFATVRCAAGGDLARVQLAGGATVAQAAFAAPAGCAGAWLGFEVDEHGGDSPATLTVRRAAID